MDKYTYWMTNELFDKETKEELAHIKDDLKEIEDRFYKDLEFGTGGLRGVLGAGTNRMNKYTVTKATQGLANYIKKNNLEDMGVVIAYDSRHMSIEFSKWVSMCLIANGIRTYRFESLRPTPELSFAVRKLKTAFGIVITASHNPSEYNGYKVYSNDGCQITPPLDKYIIDEVNAITNFADIKMSENLENGLYTEIGSEIDDLYIEELKKLILDYEAYKDMEGFEILDEIRRETNDSNDIIISTWTPKRILK